MEIGTEIIIKAITRNQKAPSPKTTATVPLPTSQSPSQGDNVRQHRWKVQHCLCKVIDSHPWEHCYYSGHKSFGNISIYVDMKVVSSFWCIAQIRLSASICILGRGLLSIWGWRHPGNQLGLVGVDIFLSLTPDLCDGVHYKNLGQGRNQLRPFEVHLGLHQII